MLVSAVLAVAALARFTVGQTSVMASASITMPPAGATSYPINVNAIPLGTRQGWCNGQQNSCRSLCEPRGPSENSCTAATLDWTCTCESGTTPNLADFNITIPFYECTYYYYTVCVGETSDVGIQQECLSKKCGGSILPISYYTSSTSSSSSSTQSSTMSTTTSASTTSSSATPNMGPMVTAVRNYGLGAVVGGVAALGLAL